MNTIICTFRGRRETGKGLDLLISLLPDLLTQSQHSWEFHIFGSGPLATILQSCADRYPDTIILHGRSTWDQIQQVAVQGHYCLCWSQILESFGLSALEGAKLGLPVIGPCKGGLEQFIIDDFKQYTTHLKTQDIQDTDILLQLLLYIDQHHNIKHQDRQQQTLNIAQNYSPEHRLKQIQQLMTI